MNHLGIKAREHWKEFLPKRYAALADPQEFFTDLGQRMMEEIDLRSQEILASQQPAQDREERIGQINMAKLIATGDVLRETALLPSSQDRVTPAR